MSNAFGKQYADVFNNLFEYIDTKYPEIPESIRTTKELSAEIEEKLVQAIKEVKGA